MAAREALRLEPPSRARTAPDSRPAAAAAPAAPRARSQLGEQLAAKLGLPLSDLHVRRIAELERLAGPGRYRGWGREGKAEDWTLRRRATWELFFVDVLDVDGELLRFTGETLHMALGAALAWARASR